MVIEKLRQAGLSTYESKAYLFLVRHGISTAYDISKGSGVPHGKIYPSLASLEEKGFVNVFLGKPKRFTAMDPQVAINQMMDRREEDVKEYKRNARSLLKEIGKIGIRKEEPADAMRTIEGYKNYLNLSVALHDRAEKSWCSISELSLYKPHVEAYKRNVKSGVDVRILTSKEEATSGKLDLWTKIGVQIRYSQYLPTKFSVIDGRSVTLRIADKDKYVSLLIENESLAKSLQNYFDFLWEKSEEA